MSKVSILIPCHNAERWVADAIRSALDQTWEDKEVIVVDDGSADQSLETIYRYGNRIRVESGPQRGGNAARNRLLELAQGEWVQFLDADDYLQPQKVQRQLQYLGDCGQTADVIYSPVTIEKWREGRAAERSVSRVDEQAGLAERWVRWQVAQTGTLLWRKQALQAIGGWNEQYPCCQDNELTMRAIQRELRFCFYPQADAVYRIWSQDTVCRRDLSRVIHYRTQLIDEMLDWLTVRGEMTPAISAAAGQACFEMARSLAVVDRKKACAYRHQRIKKGLFLPKGPAAPFSYRLMHCMIGFGGAEAMAALRRLCRASAH